MKNDLYLIIPIKDALLRFHSCSSLGINSATGLMKFLEGQSGWTLLPGWETIPDIELYRKLFEAKGPSGKVFVIAESAYIEGLGAFS